MSGFWSIGNIENYESLWVDAVPAAPMFTPSRETDDGRTQWLDPVTAILIWYLPMIHVEEITTENLEETFVRVRMLELSIGAMLSYQGKPAFITLENLRRRIGLRVGAGLAISPLEETLISGLRRSAEDALKKALSDS